MIKQDVFDELKRDRDNWRSRARKLETELHDAMAKIGDMRRAEANQARRRETWDRMWGDAL